MDKLDKRILKELQSSDRLTNAELAERVGLSATPCARRVKQLEDAGVIERHAVLLNASKLSMDRHTPERFERFESAIKQLPEVTECLLITGQSADYLLKVIVPDMEYYQEFLLNKITRIEGVTDVHSSFIMRRVVDSTQLPLNHLPDTKH
jgi:Lrp/AsnC family leucine-responsive transcriptional regulator